VPHEQIVYIGLHCYKTVHKNSSFIGLFTARTQDGHPNSIVYTNQQHFCHFLDFVRGILVHELISIKCLNIIFIQWTSYKSV